MDKKVIIIGVIVVIIAISAGLIGSSLKRLSTEEGKYGTTNTFLKMESWPIVKEDDLLSRMSSYHLSFSNRNEAI